WLVGLCSSPADCGREGIVQILLKKHARVDVKDSPRCTWLPRNNHANVVRSLLRMNAFVNAKRQGVPTHRCPGRPGGPQTRWCETASQKQDGVEVDARTLTGHCTWLLRGATKEVCETLVDHNADTKATDNNGQTPLHLAAEHDKVSRCENVPAKERHCDSGQCDRTGASCARGRSKRMDAPPCTWPLRRDTRRSFGCWSRPGRRRPRENSEGLTPLHLAAQSGHS
uniref:ANK_REP_REGION domain-containing protein n=1 Tax=Macrostomum lignano TaxID=282301 RepID=A0A1I8F989_9PLAT